MPRSERVTVSLELDISSEPIEGIVSTPDGTSHPFIGWLGLTGALEHAAGATTNPTPREATEDER